MSATAQSVAVELPLPTTRTVVPVRTQHRLEARVERWFYPFGLTLAGSLVFFMWQMAEYTTLLG